MTQTEKDMQELNMTPAKLAARQKEVAAITGSLPVSGTLTHGLASPIIASAPMRKTRSDAGKPREKKAPAVEGKLTPGQVATLDALIAQREEASRAYIEAQQAYTDFLDEITAK